MKITLNTDEVRDILLAEVAKRTADLDMNIEEDGDFFEVFDKDNDVLNMAHINFTVNFE